MRIKTHRHITITPLLTTHRHIYRLSSIQANLARLLFERRNDDPAALSIVTLLTELDRLIHDFDAGFEGDGTADDFASFPAWALLVDRALAAGLATAQEGALTPAESCARLVLRLLALERQGRHDELIAGRAKLRAAHPALFARYMRDR